MGSLSLSVSRIHHQQQQVQELRLELHHQQLELRQELELHHPQLHQMQMELVLQDTIGSLYQKDMGFVSSIHHQQRLEIHHQLRSHITITITYITVTTTHITIMDTTDTTDTTTTMDTD